LNLTSATQLAFISILAIMFPGHKYKPEDIKRIIYLSDESSKSFLSGAARGVADGLLLGGVGAIAGVLSAGSKTKIANYGVELMDGKKFIMAQSPNNDILLCMIAYPKGCGIYEAACTWTN